MMATKYILPVMRRMETKFVVVSLQSLAYNRTASRRRHDYTPNPRPTCINGIVELAPLTTPRISFLSTAYCFSFCQKGSDLSGAPGSVKRNKEWGCFDETYAQVRLGWSMFL